MSHLSRRALLLNGLACGAAGLRLGAGRAHAQTRARPRLHAMIVGIITYPGKTGILIPGAPVSYSAIRQLRGCLNDARLIEEAVKPLAATTRTLLDHQATRAGFLNAWQAMVAASSPGDTLLVTYAGHGGQEKGSVSKNAPDGLHSSFVLFSFDSSQPNLNTERLLDDEVQGLWRTVQGRNTVIFVADACHAGRMTRQPDARASDEVRYRTTHYYDIEGELSSATPLPTNPDTLDLPHVVFLSGAAYNELVPEIRIDGRVHGALSVSFARALSDRADTNRDGIITGAELSSYVLRSIRVLTESNQHAQVRWPNADVRFGLRPEEGLFFLDGRTAPADAPATAEIRLAIIGVDDQEFRRIGRSLRRAVIALPPQPADLVWDAASKQKEVVDHLGNIVASGIAASDLQAVVDRAIAVGMLRRLALRSGIDMRLLLPGESSDSPASRDADVRHIKGARVSVQANGLKYANVVLFNVAGNGTVQFLDARTGTAGPADRISTNVEVAAPFGADHLVTIASPRALSELVRTLTRTNGTKDCNAVIDALASTAKASELQVGLQGVFTAEK